jgi:hypothetical protein
MLIVAEPVKKLPGEVSDSHGGEYKDFFWDVVPCSLV